MKELFERNIDWSMLGNRDREDYVLEISDVVLRKTTGVLAIELALNFVLPFHNEQKIKGLIINAVPDIEDVEITFNYAKPEEMIQTPFEIINTNLPRMIRKANGDFSSITESIMEKDVRIEEGKVYIPALGNVVCRKLNESVAPLFQSYLKDEFDLDYKVIFENDEAGVKETEKKMDERALSLEEEIAKTSMEMAKSAPKTKKVASRAEYFSSRKAAEAPVNGNIIFGGKPVAEKIMPIGDLDPSIKKTAIGGIVFLKDMTVLKSGSVLAKLYVTDKVNSTCAKAFVSEEKWKDIDENIKVGDYIKVQGHPERDVYEGNELVFRANRIEKGEMEKRKDDFDGPHRVELHCHTKMSRMDGLNDVDKLIKTALYWEQPAIAITDHGVVQSFPDAANTVAKLSKEGKEIKVIYGMEGYVFDDSNCIAVDGTIDYKKNNTNHIILLVKSQQGMKNLYKLVSMSHIDYFYKKPRLPKSVISQYREGLIIGSACEAGEVFRAIAAGVTDEELDKIASFYDYLEIQPLINNKFMLDKGMVESREDLRDFNRRVIECGERLGKPVCATTDAHYDEPESAAYRNAMLGSMGYENAEMGQGLYLRTTGEMLEEFAYLGEEKAYEIVVENTNRIADMIEDDIRPIPLGKAPPVIENSDETLRKTCITKAKEIYGDPLPREIEERLSTELESIISNKYSVMYVSAQMLVGKSMSDGYMVGSRGSVGSSFAATMAGITEVNPLDPHYICPSCKHLEWGDRNQYECGLDMPVKNCPECGTEMKRDGFTIPFATFLGFDGTKEPDIDLNFAGEYQATAHKYVGEIFGEKNVFKAGTVSTLEAKNADRIVAKFSENTGIAYNKMQAKRISIGCQGVKYTTGQHPGGIIIVPDNREIYEFCPVQHPANKDVDIVTTHFDYHKLENNLMKLDILGHTGPSMLRHLYDMTGIDPVTVDISDEKVLSIFNSIDALDIKDPDYEYTDGTFAIPEFGTSFVRAMLQEIKPKTIADLVRIAGFSHGTDVWTNNAQDFINQGVATMREVISTRDDIMNYLILKGLENKMSFDIMEAVRKNKPLQPEQLKEMTDHGVPDWYIESCKRIQYMFPRAHAAAYVMTSLRMAWYKVHRPMEFYAAHFTASGDAFETSIITKGQGACLEAIKRMEIRGDYDSDYERKEKDKKTRPVLETAYEMYARGYKFRLPELGKSHATKFTVCDGEVLLPFVVLEGVGEQAAKSLAKAYEEQPFHTVEDAVTRARINKTAVLSLKSYGVFKGLPESDQITFFGLQ